jgi:hypothetical protein
LCRASTGIRYQVKDVARSVAFYTTHLGFTLEHQQLPAFASVSLGDAQILLTGPQASGSRPMPNGQLQEPGGWNRVVLRVTDLPGCIAAMKPPSPYPRFQAGGGSSASGWLNLTAILFVNDDNKGGLAKYTGILATVLQKWRRAGAQHDSQAEVWRVPLVLAEGESTDRSAP